jgi:hypothetical protein
MLLESLKIRKFDGTCHSVFTRILFLCSTVTSIQLEMDFKGLSTEICSKDFQELKWKSFATESKSAVEPKEMVI